MQKLRDDIKSYKINNDIDVLVRHKNWRTLVDIVNGDNIIDMCDMIADDKTFIDVRFNEYYVAVYAHCADNKYNDFESESILLNVYDIRNDKKIRYFDIDDKTKDYMYFMFLSQYNIGANTLVDILNDRTNKEVSSAIENLTCGNKNISIENVKKYILNVCPELANKKSESSAWRIFMHAMPQHLDDIKEEKESKKTLSKKYYSKISGRH